MCPDRRHEEQQKADNGEMNVPSHAGLFHVSRKCIYDPEQCGVLAKGSERTGGAGGFPIQQVEFRWCNHPTTFFWEKEYRTHTGSPTRHVNRLDTHFSLSQEWSVILLRPRGDQEESVIRTSQVQAGAGYSLQMSPRLATCSKSTTARGMVQTLH